MYEIDEQQLRKWWEIFKGEGKLVEIRLLGTNTYSGYFKDIDALISQLRPMLDQNNVQYYGNLQAYFTLNEIHEDLYSREQHDRFVKKPKSTTIDSNVVRRRMVLIDLDPSRTAGVSSSDKEYENAHLRAVAIYKYLMEQGFKEPIITTSGNGYHCYVPCDMPNDEEHNELIKRFLQGLSSVFSDDDVEIDEKVFNPARIDKLIGTWAKKGSDTKDRRWRISKILKVPSDLSPNEDALFEKIADLAPKEEPKVAPNRRPMQQCMNQPFDLVSWLNHHGIEYREVLQGGTTKYELRHCPWEDTHSSKKEWESALFQNADGQITFSCFHSHCKDKTWFDFRLFYEPNAYNKPSYQQQVVYVQSQPRTERKKYEIKDEIPELGEKWMSLSSIKKVDITNLEKVKTGFTELDYRIGGLYMSEVTVLSGSNACVDCDTEYFNGKEWKNISEYRLGEKVLQYNADGSAELVTPQRYIKSPCDELYLLQSITGVDQCVSENHNLIYMTSKGHLAKKSVKDMLSMHDKSNKGFTGKFYTTFRYEQGRGIDLTDDEIRLMCAIICDGHFPNIFRDKDIVRVNLKKERKKERIEMLLKRCNIPYRKEQYNPHDLQFNTYFFHAPRHEKEFGDYWYDCSAKQLAIVADEILYWDGSVKEELRHNSSYSSHNKKNIDFVQFAFASIGVRTHINIDNRVGKAHSGGKYFYKTIGYSLTICKTKNPSLVNPVKKKEFEKIKTRDGFKYCFTVPSGMLVLRRNGNINVTGNSGKSSWLNTLLLNVIQQNYKVALWSGELRSDILKTWIQMVAAGTRNLQRSQFDEGRYYVLDSVGHKIDAWLDGKFFLYNNEYGSNSEQVLNDMQMLLKAGVKVFVLDNMMSMSLNGYDGDKNDRQKAFVLDLKAFAMSNIVHVILVAHPRKSTAFLRKTDISGTGDIINAVDNCWIMHRVNEDFIHAITEFYDAATASRMRQYGNMLAVEKDRLFGVCDYMCGLHYDLASRRFKNTPDEDIHYGWEHEYEQANIHFQEVENYEAEAENAYFSQIDDTKPPF